MKQYCRVILGKANSSAADCREGNFVGVDFMFEQDLTDKFSDDSREFNRQLIPVLMANRPITKISAGMACGMTWTLCAGLQAGDIVLCPTGKKTYYAGTVVGSYFYEPKGDLPHRRPVKWFDIEINAADMSEALRRSAGSIGTTAMLGDYGAEIEELIGATPFTASQNLGLNLEDVSEGILEKYLQEFLALNWEKTPFATEFNIYKDEEGQMVGQQFNAFGNDRIDILAESKDKSTLLVIELKKGRGTDAAVGQVLRYMGYINTIKDDNQTVRGLIIAHEDDERTQHALSMIENVDFYVYKLQFSLTKLT